LWCVDPLAELLGFVVPSQVLGCGPIIPVFESDHRIQRSWVGAASWVESGSEDSVLRKGWTFVFEVGFSHKPAFLADDLAAFRVVDKPSPVLVPTFTRTVFNGNVNHLFVPKVNDRATPLADGDPIIPNNSPSVFAGIAPILPTPRTIPSHEITANGESKTEGMRFTDVKVFQKCLFKEERDIVRGD